MTGKKSLSIVMIIVMCLTMMSFAGCGSKDDVTAKSEFGFETAGLTEDIATGYWNLVNQKINEHGLLGTTTPQIDSEGVHGGFICDMDGNEIPELILTSFYYVNENYGYNCPAVEIYTWNGKEPVLVKLFDFYGATAGLATSLIMEKCEDGTVLVKWQEIFTMDGEAGDPNYKLFKIKGSECMSVENEDPDGEGFVVLTVDSGETTFGFESNAEALYSCIGEKAVIKSETFLEGIEYYGDRSKCVMAKEMADAYAAVLEGLPETMSNDYETGKLYAMLADPNNDGMPILITAYLDKADAYSSFTGNGYSPNGPYYGYMCSSYSSDGNTDDSVSFYGFENGKAVKCKFPNLNYTNCIGIFNGKGALYNKEFAHDVGNNLQTDIFTVENGVITYAQKSNEFSVTGFYDIETGDFSIYGDLPEDADYTLEDCKADPGLLETKGWYKEEHQYDDGDISYTWFLYLDDGKNVTEKRMARFEEYYNSGAEYILYEEGFTFKAPIAYVSDVEYDFAHETTPGKTMTSLLRDYAKMYDMFK
ncbi:MAG: hypothetical protein IJC41_06145 [Firmicutes bacterium]|nr:hypothetical protein [Bacillota bacterium]